MRKQTKIAALVSAAALLTIGASMTSFAAWSSPDGGVTWEYYDHDGSRVTEEWKTSYGSYYYLDEDGYMATNKLIDVDSEDIYYVGADGRRVTNTWISVPNEDDSTPNGQEVDTLWYYFGTNGKAYKKGTSGLDEEFTKKTVEWSGGSNIFFFDEYGHMASGWMTYRDSDNKENIYYLGDENEGYARASGKNGSTGWELLEPTDELKEEFDYEDQEWFYFQSSGKAYKADAGKKVSKYITGNSTGYFTFDENGVLQTKWFEIVTPQTASGYAAYTGVDGVKAGWVYTASKQDEDSNEWYYLVNSGDNKAMAFGAVYFGDDPDDVAAAKKEYTARVINGKTYIFNGLGQMQSGVVNLGKAENTYHPEWNGQKTNVKLNAGGIYLFSKDAHSSGGKDGRMLTGKQSIVNDDGETEYYYLAKSEKDGLDKGQAYTDSIIDGSLYGANGVRINAEDGNSYDLVTIGDDSRIGAVVLVKGKNGKWTAYDQASFLVGSNGKVKNAKVTYDDMVYVIKDYVVTQMYPKGTPTAEQPEYAVPSHVVPKKAAEDEE